MIFDCHTHTKFSADSKMTAADAIAKAESLNLGVVFTEHFDYDLPGEIDFTFDPEKYMDEYKNFRSEKIFLGAEIGLRKSARAANENFIGRVDFDMIIGSIHVVDYFDIYLPDFYVGKDKATAYRKYFAAMAEETAVEDFDVLGHIDYICRAAPYDDPEIDYKTFKPEIDKVLKIIVERKKILELNTRRLDKVRALKELVPIYRSYKNFGGRFITIGSDAHRVEAVGANFDAAINFAKELDLIPVTFRERKMITSQNF